MEFTVRPDPENPSLTRDMCGLDQDGKEIGLRVIEERPLTIFLNAQEIVTVMTIRDHPEYLALGYLLNQRMLLPDDDVTAIDFDPDIEIIDGHVHAIERPGLGADIDFEMIKAKTVARLT